MSLNSSHHLSRQGVKVGNILIGANAPVVIQSMTSTDTAEVEKTITQIKQLSDSGSELIRVTVNNDQAAAAVPEIVNTLMTDGYDTPIIGDFHFNGHKLLEKNPECASSLAKYRINPGNVGRGKNRDIQFHTMIKMALKYDKPVRIGVNWGSLDQQILAQLLDQNAKEEQPRELIDINRMAVIQSALSSAKMAQDIGLTADKIIISCKMSHVNDLVAVYRELARQSNYALHLGLTEAGMGDKGIIASTAALAILLDEGIGDTIRISLTPEPGSSRSREVIVAQQILQSLNKRSFNPVVVACPGCGRTSSDFFQILAQQIQKKMDNSIKQWRVSYPGVEQMSVAVMGCVVNGPGESKHANIGISLPGNGEQPVAPVYEDGIKTVTLKGDNIAQEFILLVDKYVARTYG